MMESRAVVVSLGTEDDEGLINERIEEGEADGWEVAELHVTSPAIGGDVFISPKLIIHMKRQANIE